MSIEAPSTFNVPSIYRLTPYEFPETTGMHYHHYCTTNTCGQLCCCRCGAVMNGAVIFPAIMPEGFMTETKLSFTPIMSEGFVTETGFLLSAAP